MKSKKEMTVEEKAQKFHEMHPDYPNFKTPEEEHLYLLKMKEELELKNAILDREIEMLTRCNKVLKNHHLQVAHINEMNISSKQKLKLLKLNAVNTLREHIKIEWVYEITDPESSIMKSKQDVIILIFLLDTIDKYGALN
jgi:hypothetical protein